MGELDAHEVHLLVAPRRVAARMVIAPAKIFTIFEGTSEIQHMIIGRAVTWLDVR